MGPFHAQRHLRRGPWTFKDLLLRYDLKGGHGAKITTLRACKPS